jgi:putative peptidoglycan lipid II flippase
VVRQFLTVIGREVRGMHQAAYLLAAFALLSQLLALVRDRLFAAEFGAGHTLDIYYAAFRIPDLLFATVASLLSLYALLPVLSRLAQDDEGRMVSFLRQMLLFFFVGMGIISLVAFILAPWLLRLLAPGINSPELLLLTRILLLQPIFLGASNILANLTQMRHRFLLYSISPLLYNLGIIAGVVFLYPRMGVAGLGWGVVIGACLHLLVQVPFFASERSSNPMPLKESLREFWKVLALSVPRTLSLGANQISLAALTAIASFLAPGSISIFMFGWNLQAVPLTIIGVSYSVAAFPTLSKLHASGDTSAFARHVEVALRHIFFWTIPATVLIIVLRAQLVRAILGAGAFDWAATKLVAAALALFIISLLAQSASLLIARAYYAAGNTHKPFYFGIIDVVVSVSSALLFIALFHGSFLLRWWLEALLRVSDLAGTTVLMLAFAMALGSIAEFAVGFWYLRRDFNLELKPLWRLTFESLGAAILGGAAAYLALTGMGQVVDINTATGILAQGFAGGIWGLGVAIGVLVLLKNPEIKEAYVALKSKLGPAPKIALEPTDVSS